MVRNNPFDFPNPFDNNQTEKDTRRAFSQTQKKEILAKQGFKCARCHEKLGVGYHFDVQFIIKNLKLEITMTIVADLPLIKPEIIDEIIEKYFIFNKPALSVTIDAKSFAQHGLTPTITFQSNYGQKSLVPLGINVIDGRLIDQPKLDEAIFISERLELMYNINTVDDYFQLIKYFNKKEK